MAMGDVGGIGRRRVSSRYSGRHGGFAGSGLWVKAGRGSGEIESVCMYSYLTF